MLVSLADTRFILPLWMAEAGKEFGRLKKVPVPMDHEITTQKECPSKIYQIKLAKERLWGFI